MRNDVYNKAGINKSAQARRGIRDFYNSFFKFTNNPHPFSFFHGCDLKTAHQILRLGAVNSNGFPIFPEEYVPERDRDAVIAKILKEAKYYRYRWGVGGRNSAKTKTAMYTALRYSTDLPGNLGQMVRADWKNVEATLMLEFEQIAKEVTDGEPKHLIRLHKHVGYNEYTIFSSGSEVSKIFLFPEPKETLDRKVADALKSPEGGSGWFYIDELSETREITQSTLEDNLRRKVAQKAGLATSNAFTDKHWAHRIDQEQQRRIEDGRDARILILRSSIYDNPYADPDNVREMEEKYADDPIGRAMLLEGRDGVEIKGKPCFPEFRTKHHVSENLRCNPAETLYVGLDWGYHHPAAVFCQPTEDGCWNIFSELIGDDWTLDVFAERIYDHLRMHYPWHSFEPGQSSNVEFHADPAGDFQSERGNTTIEEFAARGIKCRFRMDSRFPGKRVDVMRDMLLETRGERRRLMVHPRCTLVIQGFVSGLHYRIGPDGNISEKPHKDGLYEHIFDAAGYLFWDTVGPRGRVKKKGGPPPRAKGPRRKEMK